MMKLNENYSIKYPKESLKSRVRKKKRVIKVIYCILNSIVIKRVKKEKIEEERQNLEKFEASSRNSTQLRENMNADATGENIRTR